MIRPLRKRHRHMVVVIGVFLPVAFAVGIAVRKPVPVVNSLPPELAPVASHFELPAWQRADLFAKSPVTVYLMREHGGAERWAIGFSAAKDFVKPDLIVYWVVENQTIKDTLPDNAILLGSFSSTPLALPDEAAQSTSRLVLFSLADNEIVDASKPLPGAPASLPASAFTNQANPPAGMPALQ